MTAVSNAPNYQALFDWNLDITDTISCLHGMQTTYHEMTMYREDSSEKMKAIYEGLQSMCSSMELELPEEDFSTLHKVILDTKIKAIL